MAKTLTQINSGRKLIILQHQKKKTQRHVKLQNTINSSKDSVVEIKSILIAAEIHYIPHNEEQMKQTSTTEQMQRTLKAHQKSTETQCTAKPIKTSKTPTRSNNGQNIQKKQNDSTRNFIIQTTSWNKHDGRAITSKTVARLHKIQPNKTLVNTPDTPSTTRIHKRTTILDIRKHAKGH